MDRGILSGVMGHMTHNLTMTLTYVPEIPCWWIWSGRIVLLLTEHDRSFSFPENLGAPGYWVLHVIWMPDRLVGSRWPIGGCSPHMWLVTSMSVTVRSQKFMHMWVDKGNPAPDLSTLRFRSGAKVRTCGRCNTRSTRGPMLFWSSRIFLF